MGMVLRRRRAERERTSDLDAEFERARRKLLDVLDELKVEVERAEYREQARDRIRQRRHRPAT